MDATKAPVCDTCELGCDCEARTRGCGHYACWGSNKHTTRCPSADDYAAQTRAYLQRNLYTAW